MSSVKVSPAIVGRQGEPPLSVYNPDNSLVCDPVMNNVPHPQQQRQQSIHGNASHHSPAGNMMPVPKKNSFRSVVSHMGGRRILRRHISLGTPGTDSKQVAMMYDVFLNIQPDCEEILSLKLPVKEIVKEYGRYKLNDCNLALTVLVAFILVIYLVFGAFATQYVFVAPTANPFMTVSVSTSIACIILLLVTVTHRFFVTTDNNHPSIRPLQRIFMKLNESPMIMRLLNDSLPIFLVVRTGFKLLGRVSSFTACDPARTFKYLYDCNPTGGVRREIPPETYAFCLYVVLLPQMFIKGASRGALCLSW